MTNFFYNKKYILLLILFVILLNIQNTLYSNNKDINKQLLQMRVDYYDDKYIPKEEELISQYKKIENIKNREDRLYSMSIWAILYSELICYYYIDIDKESLDFLNEVYSSLKNDIKKSNDSNLFKNMGELSFLMLKVSQKNKMVHILDTRDFFLKSIKLNKNNHCAKLGLGKWWGYLTLTKDHRELNHPRAQVYKYLSDENIDKIKNGEQNEWVDIDILNALYIRSLVNIRTLKTSDAYKDLEKAQNIYPKSYVIKKLSNQYAKNITGWDY